MTNIKKSPTWADLKAFTNTLSEDQLSQPVRWWGDERGGTVSSLNGLEEDYVLDDEGYSPKSSYDPTEVDEIIEENGVMPKGTPMLYVD